MTFSESSLSPVTQSAALGDFLESFSTKSAMETLRQVLGKTAGRKLGRKLSLKPCWSRRSNFLPVPTGKIWSPILAHPPCTCQVVICLPCLPPSPPSYITLLLVASPSATPPPNPTLWVAAVAVTVAIIRWIAGRGSVLCLQPMQKQHPESSHSWPHDDSGRYSPALYQQELTL